ncbi:hypothetical protein HHK36_004919 [Tetracentron sinense]|uniref:50S ribosomal protein L14 n=1 Tax=Tetracentron sinense TaxID=13715 RepID=A0A834ZNK5_TETSI|nr:hypothetical protein HHK36_004919 [Tetracentron sinense]
MSTSDCPRQWDCIIPQAEFAYNSSKNRSSGRTPSKVVYGRNPNHILDHVSIPNISKISMEAEEFADHDNEIHRQVQERLQHTYDRLKEVTDVHRRHVEFEEGEIMVYLRKEIFPAEYSKTHRKHEDIDTATFGGKVVQQYSVTLSAHMVHQGTFIQMRTNLKVVDNSGAKRVMCIQALKGKKGARLGDTIIASVKEAQPRGKVKKGDVVYGVVVRAAMQRGRCDGSEIKFDDNAVVLVNKQGEPIGTRVFGPVPHE